MTRSRHGAETRTRIEAGFEQLEPRREPQRKHPLSGSRVQQASK